MKVNRLCVKFPLASKPGLSSYYLCGIMSRLHWMQYEKLTSTLVKLTYRAICLAQVSNDLVMASSNGNILRVTGHLCGNSPVTGEFLAQRPVTQSIGVFFVVLRLNKRLIKNNRKAGDLRRDHFWDVSFNPLSTGMFFRLWWEIRFC